MTARFADVEKLHADDIAEAVTYVVTGPVAEIVTRPTDQVRERWIVRDGRSSG